MQHFSTSPAWVLGSLRGHDQLIWQLIKRDVLGRYRGSVMGILWSFFYPLLMLAVYTFVFSVVFQSRWGGGTGSKVEFAMVVFTGMIVHGLFAESVNRAPQLVLNNVNYVKKVVFPLEILPWVSIGSSLFHTGISTVVLLLFVLVANGALHWTAVLFPIVIVPLVLVTIGMSWFLASFGVYVRDVGQIVSVVTSVLMFLSPVFYPVSALPEAYQPLMRLNPLTLVIEQGRDVLLWGKMPDWRSWLLYLALSTLVAWTGFAWFQKTRRGFADVL